MEALETAVKQVTQGKRRRAESSADGTAEMAALAVNSATAEEHEKKPKKKGSRMKGPNVSLRLHSKHKKTAEAAQDIYQQLQVRNRRLVL